MLVQVSIMMHPVTKQKKKKHQKTGATEKGKQMQTKGEEGVR